ncbi:MAG: hypothetical protein JWP04_3412 [Belnapia sp.]|nr:hypothetical protein [Belnapia sp.]
MRCPILVPALLSLAACDPAGVATGAAVVGGSVAVIGRTPVDAVVSVVSGRDCSAVRLDRGMSYCRPEEAPPAPPPFCTRSLGRVYCWTTPMAGRRGVADGAATLSETQEAHRTRHWPALW